MTTVLHAKLQPVRDPEKTDAVLKAINEFDLSEASVWRDLDILSSHTQFEELDADRAGIFSRGDGTIEVEGVVYVTLQYGSKKDAVSMGDSYPVKITGKLSDELNFKIDTIKVDTSSFFD